MLEPSTMPHAGRRRLGLARLPQAAIALTALIVLALSVAGALAPRLSAAAVPIAIFSDGGKAFTFSPGFAAPWPYAVPSHPDFALAPGDVRVTEDGRSIGMLEPAHATIREKGGGRFNLWEGTLWFSSSDSADPRSDGRSYRVEVQTRLAASASSLRNWALAALLALVMWRIGPATLRRAAIVGAAIESRIGIGRVTAQIPITLGQSFTLASALTLGSFAWGILAHPMPLMLETDSLGYIGPGLTWAAGTDMTGQSARDLGYPWLTLMAVRLGSIGAIPKLQLLMVLTGLCCTLGVIFLMSSSLARRLRRSAMIPRWVVGTLAAATAVTYVALISAHDLFMLDIDSAMAEAPHFLPSALTLILIVGGLIARSSRTRIVLIVFAALLAYTSVMFKPNTLIVLALCLLTLAVVSLRHWRSIGAPIVLTAFAVAAVCAATVYRFDARVTPTSGDFGPKTLFCNHLDVIEPVFSAATPERSRIQSLSRDVLRKAGGWPLMGFDGDACMYGAAFTAALVAVSASEGATPGEWEQREFVKAVIRNPIGYAQVVAKQVWFYLRHPWQGMDTSIESSLSGQDWQVLEPFAGLMKIARQDSGVRLDNWVPLAYPGFAGAAKWVLGALSDLFAPVTLGSTALALMALVRRRTRTDLHPEVILVTTAVFTSAFVGTTALSHTFDIARYATDVMPFSLLWWMVGAVYLAQSAVLVGASSRRGARSDLSVGFPPPVDGSSGPESRRGPSQHEIT